jgi:hypothetical protein
MTTKPDATSVAVVICCYTEDRCNDIRRAVGSPSEDRRCHFRLGGGI